MTEDKTKKQSNAAAVEFLWDLILAVGGSYLLKTSWNSSLVQMFPALHPMKFNNAVSLLIVVYIISRVAAVGFVAEVVKTTNQALQGMLVGVNTALESVLSGITKKKDALARRVDGYVCICVVCMYVYTYVCMYMLRPN